MIAARKAAMPSSQNGADNKITVFMRPKTGLQEMVAALEQAIRRAGRGRLSPGRR
jgi:hypothetical protein